MVARIWLSNFSRFRRKSGFSATFTVTFSKKAVDGRAQTGEGRHRAGEILALQRGLHKTLDVGQGSSNGFLFRLFHQCGIGRAGDLRGKCLVLLLLGANDLAARP